MDSRPELPRHLLVIQAEGDCWFERVRRSRLQLEAAIPIERQRQGDGLSPGAG